VTPELTDEMWEAYYDHVLPDEELQEVGDSPAACVRDYMSWYIRVSHPWMTPEAYAKNSPRYLEQPEPHPEEPQPQPEM
jgi:hypothetical protein